MEASVATSVCRPRVGTMTENATSFTTALSERAARAALRPPVLAAVGLRRAVLPRRRAPLREDAPAPARVLGRPRGQAGRRPRLVARSLSGALFRQRAA